MTFTVYVRAALVYPSGTVCARIRIHGLVNAETVRFRRIVIVVAECQSAPLVRRRCTRGRTRARTSIRFYRCVSVVDARWWQ